MSCCSQRGIEKQVVIVVERGIKNQWDIVEEGPWSCSRVSEVISTPKFIYTRLVNAGCARGSLRRADEDEDSFRLNKCLIAEEHHRVRVYTNVAIGQTENKSLQGVNKFVLREKRESLAVANSSFAKSETLPSLSLPKISFYILLLAAAISRHLPVSFSLSSRQEIMRVAIFCSRGLYVHTRFNRFADRFSNCTDEF